MRAVAAAASCISVGLVLQGCGGGGSTDTCLSEKLDVVSQTLKGKMEVSADVTHDGTTMSNSTQTDFTVMLDFKTFNMRLDVSGESPDGVKMTGTTILDMDKKQAVGYESLTQNCSIVDLPDNFPPAVQMKIMLDTFVKPFLEQQAVCGGNDGTYDTWKFSYNYSGDLPKVPEIPDAPPLPSLDGLKIKDGLVSEDVAMSQDQLLHSSTTRVSGELLNGTESVGSLKMTASLTVDDAKSGGPSSADLDASQFGVECTKVTPPTNPFDALPGFVQQRLFRIMAASKTSEHALIV